MCAVSFLFLPIFLLVKSLFRACWWSCNTWWLHSVISRMVNPHASLSCLLKLCKYKTALVTCCGLSFYYSQSNPKWDTLYFWGTNSYIYCYRVAFEPQTCSTQAVLATFSNLSLSRWKKHCFKSSLLAADCWIQEKPKANTQNWCLGKVVLLFSKWLTNSTQISLNSLALFA